MEGTVQFSVLRVIDNELWIEGRSEKGVVSRNVTHAKSYVEPVLRKISIEMGRTEIVSSMYILFNKDQEEVNVSLDIDLRGGDIGYFPEMKGRRSQRLTVSKHDFIDLLRDLSSIQELHEFKPKFNQNDFVEMWTEDASSKQYPYPLRVHKVIRKEERYLYYVGNHIVGDGIQEVDESRLREYSLT